MALIRIDTLKCIRRKDFSGEDEPEICIAGLSVWSGKPVTRFRPTGHT
jgi:hypothetical protein